MSGKVKLLVGFGAGYLLGTRAGRERYDQIARKAQELWRDPRVQEKAGQAQQVVKEKVGDKVGDKVSGNGSGSSTSSGRSAASSTTGAASKTASSTGPSAGRKTSS